MNLVYPSVHGTYDIQIPPPLNLQHDYTIHLKIVGCLGQGAEKLTQ